MPADRADMLSTALKDRAARTCPDEGLILGCITEREDPADALVVHASIRTRPWPQLPKQCGGQAGSLAPLAQLRHHFPILCSRMCVANRHHTAGEISMAGQ